MNLQVEATRDICYQLARMNRRIDKYFGKDKYNPDTIRYYPSFRDSIDLDIKLIDDKIDSLILLVTPVEPQETEEECFFNRKFWRDFITKLAAALIAFGGSLYIFLRGFTKKDEKEAIKKKERDVARLSYMATVAKKSLVSASSQSENISKYCDQLEENPLVREDLSFSTYEDVNRLIKLLNNGKYYDSYFNLNDGIQAEDNYSKLSSSIDFLKKQLDQLEKMEMRSRLYDHERKIKYRDIINNFNIDITSFGDQLRQNNPELSQRILILLQNHDRDLEGNLGNMDYFQQTMVLPFRDLLNNYRYDPRIVQFVDSLKKAILIYDDIILQNIEHSSTLRSINKNMEKSCHDLEVTINESFKE